MKRLLITGANGQMGQSFRILTRAHPFWEFLFTDVGELDITNSEAVNRFLQQEKPDVIINCAAYTAVDKAEEEPQKAMMINARAPGILARESNKINALLIHISTDYVFDGLAHMPYVETDLPNPISEYARSKYFGEEAVRKDAHKAVILRTSWLYSEFGNNFVRTMIRLGRERKSLNVIFDQTGTPTYAMDLCETILKILPELDISSGTEIYHFANEGVASWYDFSQAIMALAEIDCRVLPIETSGYPLPAKRPYYSVMNKTKIKNQFDLDIPYWRDGLGRCLNNILKEK